MKIILTGITGNIGCEVAVALLRDRHTIIPIVRPAYSGEEVDCMQKLKDLNPEFSVIRECIFADLENGDPKHSLEEIDCIVHCAGSTHFNKAGDSNETMMKNILALAEDSAVPIFYISTAYLYKPNGEPLFNQYEIDKSNAEAVLTSSSSPSCILRPSIVTGSSKTGKMIHFSGYYLAVPSFIKALRNSDKIRFPSIQNGVNIIPVDWVAQCVADAVKAKMRGLFYIVNPNPPSCNELLRQTVEFFGPSGKLEFIDLSIDEFQKLKLTEIERKLFTTCTPFMPYLTTEYNFPSSLCSQSLEAGYIGKILRYFAKLKSEKLEK